MAAPSRPGRRDWARMKGGVGLATLPSLFHLAVFRTCCFPQHTMCVQQDTRRERCGGRSWTGERGPAASAARVGVRRLSRAPAIELIKGSRAEAGREPIMPLPGPARSEWSRMGRVGPACRSRFFLPPCSFRSEFEHIHQRSALPCIILNLEAKAPHPLSGQCQLPKSTASPTQLWSM